MALAAAIAIVFLGGLVGVAVHDPGRSHPHPSDWDPRVLSLVRFVEEARDLDFRQPVFVDFLTPAEYTAETTTDEDDLDDDSRDGLGRQAAELRALGLASGDVDLFAAYNAVSDGGTLAFYDPNDGRIRVRGTELTVGLRVTLVHELTHALQDQHFNLSRLYADDLDSSAATAFRALIEGDALRVEDAYTGEGLTDDERTAYDNEYAELVRRSSVSTSEVPPFITASFGVPYLLGQPFVTMLANTGGTRAINDAFDDPPFTEEHLFDPASYRANEGAEEADLGLDDDVDILDRGSFGSPSWYLVLAERIDPKVAFEAALGWAGDTYASYEREGRSCVRVAFIGDSDRDEQQMAAALDDWIEQLPGGKARTLDLDDHPGFEACDPGPDVDMQLSGRVVDALYVPALWAYLVADAATELDESGSRCYASEVMAALSYEEMTDQSGAAFTGDAFQQLLDEAFIACA